VVGTRAALGVGEILLNSMDADGTERGYDLEMIRAVAARRVAAGDCQWRRWQPSSISRRPSTQVPTRFWRERLPLRICGSLTSRRVACADLPVR